jgi:hypothetical protein
MAVGGHISRVTASQIYEFAQYLISFLPNFGCETDEPDIETQTQALYAVLR